MPLYKRRYNKRTKRYYYQKRRGNIYARRTTNKALRLARYAVKHLNVEYKIADRAGVGVTLGTPYINGLTNIAQGTSPSQREGRRVELKKMILKVYFELNDTTPTATMIRMLVVRKINNDAAANPPITDILNFASVNSLRNLDNTDNYKVLYDRVYSMDPNSQKFRHLVVPFSWAQYGIKQVYRLAATTGSTVDIERNSLFIIFISSETTNPPSVSWDTRIRFIDN